MLKMLLFWFLSALTLMLIAFLMPGIVVSGLGAALIAALVMGLINVSLRPLTLLLTLPINILTLGLFAFVVNALMFWLASALVPGFEVTNFWSALFGSILMALITSLFDNSQQHRFSA